MVKKTNTAALPKSRLSRLARLGSLAGGVATGMLAEGARQLAQGQRPKAHELLLTPANAQRVANQLAQLRGAAMKVGQLLSMDAGDLLPDELTEILSRLRSDAKPMPSTDLLKVLESQWGRDWQTQFKQFSFSPIASASIGQVHEARTKDGRHLALKIQYPGVRESIDSDVDNVATLIRMSGLLPKGIDINPLLDEAKAQLQMEADYLQEADYLSRYQTLLQGDNAFVLPELHKDLTSSTILAMSYVEGQPVETLGHLPQEQRDQLVTQLMRLLFKELFAFKLVQTDPNFANYQYNLESQQLVLLDFGATRVYPDAIATAYGQLMMGAVEHDRQMMHEAAASIGFFQNYIHDAQRELIIDIFQQACEPLAQPGRYDFSTTDLAARIKEAGMSVSTQRDYWHTPPADAIFLHRKLAGLYLLAARLGARVDVRDCFLQQMAAST